MPRKQLEQATVCSMGSDGKRGVQKAVNSLGQELRDALFVIIATAPHAQHASPPPHDDDEQAQRDFEAAQALEGHPDYPFDE
jgi:hypothetical protein